MNPTMRTASLLIITALALTSASCRRRERNLGPWDGGVPTLREECIVPGDKCHRDCYDRKASHACGACCGDQDVLCNTQQPYSFESCKGTE